MQEEALGSSKLPFLAEFGESGSLASLGLTSEEEHFPGQ
jgi:hypothetical protein